MGQFIKFIIIYGAIAILIIIAYNAIRKLKITNNMLEFRKLIGQKSIHESYLKILDTKNLWRNKSFVKAKIRSNKKIIHKFIKNNSSLNLLTKEKKFQIVLNCENTNVFTQ